jgi:hypothetical protein
LLCLLLSHQCILPSSRQLLHSDCTHKHTSSIYRVQNHKWIIIICSDLKPWTRMRAKDHPTLQQDWYPSNPKYVAAERSRDLGTYLNHQLSCWTNANRLGNF